MKNWKILALTILIGLPLLASAHLPRLVFTDSNSEVNSYVIENPTISQAFYGEFKDNKKEFYKVSLNGEEELYLSLLTPTNSDAAKEVSAYVIKLDSPDSDTKLDLNGKDFDWQIYHEEYAGDTYLQGPSAYKVLPAGEYMIVVLAKNNVGKYVLVSGRTESFPISEAIKTLLVLPTLKTQFFNESFFSIFSGIIGKYILAGIFAAILIIYLLILIFAKIFKRKPKAE